MTNEELHERMIETFKKHELALVNFNIYLNIDHIEYYMRYHIGDYQFCFDYLLKNRSLLKLKHTPKNLKKDARKTLEQVRAMNIK